MQRYLSLFKASSIKVLLADREFIGTQWITFLCEKDIPFAIRLKQDMMVQLLDEDEHKRLYSFKSLMRKRKPTRPQVQWQGWLNGMASCHCLHFVARRLATGELLIIATNYHTPKAALNLYRKRWAIECLFGDTKTRGFNMEDTHMTNPQKLSTLLAIVTMAMTWAYRCMSKTIGNKASACRPKVPEAILGGFGITTRVKAMG